MGWFGKVGTATWPHWIAPKHSENAPASKPGARRYVFSLACLLFAFVARYLLNPILREELPYAFFSPAAMLAAWNGGFVPGLVVLGIGLLCGHFFFVPPQGMIKSVEWMEDIRLISVALPGLISIWIIELLHRARNRADKATVQERRHALQLENEIHDRERAERGLRFSQDITKSISEAETFRAALGIALHKICEFTGWSLGHAWVPSISKTKAELCPEICTCHKDLEEFRKLTEQTTFPPGVGLVGRVWQSKKPLWISDVPNAPGFLRAAAAQKAGIKTALFFPIVPNDDVIAVLEFFHQEFRDEDEALVRLISNVSAQLGTVMQRKQAEQRLLESERRLNEAQAIARIGSWEWNAQTDDLIWSDEVFRLFDIDPKHFGHSYRDFIESVHPEDRAFVASLVRKALAEGNAIEFEHKVIWRDGSIRHMHCHGTAVRNAAGQIIKIFGTAQDITEQKETRLALAAARRQLQDYASSLERQVAARTVELEKSLRETEILLYSIAHDLRSPLRAMEGFTHIILDEYAPQMDDTGKEYARRVMDASKRMDRLIADLLAYGRLTHIDFPKREISLDVLINRVLARFRIEIENKKAQIDVMAPLPALRTNETALEQILSNLISNGLKFVGPNVAPHLRILAQKRDGIIRIEVHDNGIGIPKEFQQKIFKVFERIHRPDEYEGTGVGLAVVRKGVERLGGKVGVDSEVGQGSCFWLELPETGRAADEMEN